MFFLILGCSGAPKKPLITLCVIDFPAMEAICAETSGEQIERVKELNSDEVKMFILESKSVRRIPLSAMDKSVVIDPPNWERFTNYLGELEEYAKHKCGS